MHTLKKTEALKNLKKHPISVTKNVLNYYTCLDLVH